MRRVGFLLPLVLIAALAIPAGASAHKMGYTRLENKVERIAQARVADPSSPWFNHQIEYETCRLSRGNRRHQHLGSCVVSFDHVDGQSCRYRVHLKFRSSRSYRFRAPGYTDLQPWDYTCPSRP